MKRRAKQIATLATTHARVEESFAAIFFAAAVVGTDEGKTVGVAVVGAADVGASVLPMMCCVRLRDPYIESRCPIKESVRCATSILSGVVNVTLPP